MKERPILFSAPMVRAILAGSKSQTRRVIKFRNRETESLEHGFGPPCPYGQPGDRLWVRETFGHSWHHAQPAYFYRASDEKAVGCHPDFDGWKPSIHMPRAASRITLEITGVRVERLQACNEVDARAEGVEALPEGGFRIYHKELGKIIHATDAQTSYQSLWNSINGAGTWAANPWVWVVELRRI